MPQFKDITGAQFLDEFNGIPLFQKCTPKIYKFPHFMYNVFRKKSCPDVIEYCLKMDRCTVEEAKDLEYNFNLLYGDPDGPSYWDDKE